jgi:putative SOS response-associated peptidase YedK
MDDLVAHLADEAVGLPLDVGDLHVPNDYNVAPTRSVLVVRPNDDDTALMLEPMHWGLVPAWAKDPSGASRMINARMENLHERPSYRGLLAGRRHHRCVVPMSGFYEWHGSAGSKQPIYVRPRNTPVMCAAGLWTRSDKLGITSVTIITRDAYPEVAPWHHRSPAVVAGADLRAWLTDSGDGLEHLVGAPSPAVEVRAVDREVNSVRNNHPGLIRPADPPGPTQV